jgi:hypothetical protein
MFRHIKVIYTSIIIFFYLIFGSAQAGSPISVIPKPASTKIGQGEFELNRACRLVLMCADPNLISNAEYFKTIIAKSTGYNLDIVQQTDDMNNTIVFELSNNFQYLEHEGYELNVTKQGIRKKARPVQEIFMHCRRLGKCCQSILKAKKLLNGHGQYPVAA